MLTDALYYRNRRGDTAISIDDGETVYLPTGRHIGRLPAWVEIDEDEAEPTTEALEAAAAAEAAETAAVEREATRRVREAAEKAAKAEALRIRKAERAAAQKVWLASPEGRAASAAQDRALDNLIQACSRFMAAANTPKN